MRHVHNILGSIVGLLALALSGCAEDTTAAPEDVNAATDALKAVHSEARQLAGLGAPIAGVAGGKKVVFVGEPLDSKVVVLSRATGKQIGELPPPPGGFPVPFILHSIGDGKVAVMAAGGLPQPEPFVPAQPVIFEYSYQDSAKAFSANLTRTIPFDAALIGFPEDFAKLKDGRYLLTDAILGSIWIAETDGTIVPGIIPPSFDPQDFLPGLALCPTMPQITVNGYPFLFTASTIPGISPLAVRDGTVFFYSPCARGIYSFPLAILSDGRLPWERAADIHLVAATPQNVEVEELLGLTFNTADPYDKALYAADALTFEVIRIDPSTGARQVLSAGPTLFDFPSALAFLPKIDDDQGATVLAVASNQQERSPLTNDAVATETFNLPFVIGRIAITR
jgi:hypothetical protein